MQAVVPAAPAYPVEVWRTTGSNYGEWYVWTTVNGRPHLLAAERVPADGVGLIVEVFE